MKQNAPVTQLNLLLLIILQSLWGLFYIGV